MTWQSWCGFVVAAAALGLVPGPGVMSIVGYAIGAGRRVALASVAGMAVGNAVAMILSLSGVGLVLAASALAFSVVKWAGALYLIGFGLLTLWRARGTLAEAAVPVRALSPRAAFLGNVAVGTFHPKTIVFFVSFVPQFIHADASYPPQAALLVLTFVGVVAATDTTYALLATRAAAVLRRPRNALWFRRAGGGALVASGIATAAVRT